MLLVVDTPPVLRPLPLPRRLDANASVLGVSSWLSACLSVSFWENDPVLPNPDVVVVVVVFVLMGDGLFRYFLEEDDLDKLLLDMCDVFNIFVAIVCLARFLEEEEEEEEVVLFSAVALVLCAMRCCLSVKFLVL